QREGLRPIVPQGGEGCKGGVWIAKYAKLSEKRETKARMRESEDAKRKREKKTRNGWWGARAGRGHALTCSGPPPLLHYGRSHHARATGAPGATMTAKQPFGLWSSPLSPRAMAASLRLGDVQWDSDGRRVVWLESRDGRGSLWCA